MRTPAQWFATDMTFAFDTRDRAAFERALQQHLARIESLADTLAHGSNEHRAWIRKAIDDHIAGRPVHNPVL